MTPRPLPPESVQETARAAREMGIGEASVALVLGSGWRAALDALEISHTLELAKLPLCPVPRVAGHTGRLIYGTLSGRPILALDGRCHLYEGYTPEEATFGVRLLVALGARTLILTNASGGLRETWKTGTIFAIRDQIDWTFSRPMEDNHRIGAEPIFDPELLALAHESAQRIGIDLEEGIYAGVRGPNYETRAEIRMLRRLGADAVGMSTVLESRAARNLGARVLGLSLVTNACCEIAHPSPLTHEEVLDAGNRAGERLRRLFEALLSDL
jgi:purine-nucleoside phosphorylase